MVKNVKKFLLKIAAAKVIELKELLLAIKKWVCIKTAHPEKKVIALEVAELKATDVVQTTGRAETGIVKLMKGVNHYKKDGSIHNGGKHKMPDGSLHSGKSHTKTSQKLFHYGDLTKKSKTKAKTYWSK